MEPVAETQLIGRIIEGRWDLFGELLQPHLTALARMVQAEMSNDPDAEDVVQQTIVKALIGLKHFRSEASFRTWLIRIAINEILQWRRRHALWRKHALGLDRILVPDRAPSPFKESERNERTGQLYQAIAKLPGKYQAVIRLRDLEELDASETAQRLCLTVPGAKTRHWRARRQLSMLLRQFAT